MHEWHHRITKETIEWLEETDLIKRWKADNTTEDRKPLIQMDTLVLMAKKFRNADANGNLVMDEQCKPYLPPPASQGQPVLGVWTNPSSPGMPCLLLRGACVGIGGQTLREYLDQSRMDEGGGSQPAAALFRYAFQEKWVMSPLHVRVVVHVQLQTEEFLCAGVTEAIEAAVQEVLGAEERTVRLEKVTAGDGRDYVPPPFGADLPTQLETLLFIKVLCGNDPVLAARREEQMARPALLEAVLNAARKDLHMRLPDGCVTLHAPPRTDSAARCDRCDGPFLAHVTDTRPEVVAGAQDKYAAMLGKVGYNGAVPAKDAWRTCILPLLTEEELRAREESQRIGWLRRLANLDFEDTEEVQALQALGLLDPGDPVKDAPHAGERAADYANLTEGATNDARRKIREPYWDLAGVDPSEDAELYAEAGTPENPLPAGLGMGPNGSFTDPVALETHTWGHPEGDELFGEINEEVRRRYYGADGEVPKMDPPPPPSPRTKWTRRVPHPVLIGHAASLSQVAKMDPELRAELFSSLDFSSEQDADRDAAGGGRGSVHAPWDPSKKPGKREYLKSPGRKKGKEDDWRLELFKPQRTARARAGDARERAEERMLQEALRMSLEVVGAPTGGATAADGAGASGAGGDDAMGDEGGAAAGQEAGTGGDAPPPPPPEGVGDAAEGGAMDL